MSARIEGPIPHDVLRRLYRRVAGAAVTFINEGRTAYPNLLGIELDADGHVCGELLFDPHMVNTMQSSEPLKDMMMALVRASLDDKRLDVVVHVTETWHVALDFNDKAAMQRYRQMRADGGSVKDMPGHGESLLVAMHCREGTCVGMMPINPGPPRSTKLVELDVGQLGSSDYTGTMSLNPKKEPSP